MIRSLVASALIVTGLSLPIQSASVPRPLADVTVPTATGQKIKLSQYRGKVMVIALISTTCVHCLTSLQTLSQIQKDYGAQGFQAFAVAADDSAERGVKGLTRMNTGFPMGYLDQETTMRLCDFKKEDHPFVPMYLFVDKKGTVRFQYAGKDDFFKAEEKNTRILVEALLKE